MSNFSAAIQSGPEIREARIVHAARTQLLRETPTARNWAPSMGTPPPRACALAAGAEGLIAATSNWSLADSVWAVAPAAKTTASNTARAIGKSSLRFVD